MRSKSSKNIALLLLSCSVSGIGTGISLLAIPWFLIEQNGSNVGIGVFYIVIQVSAFLALPLFSNVVDHCSRRKITLFCFGVGAVVQFAFAALAQKNVDDLFIIVWVAGLISFVLRSFDQLNRTAWAKELVNPSQYRDVNRWLEICRQVITFAAGGVAIVVFQYKGIGTVLLLDAMTYLLGILFVLRMNNLPKTKADEVSDRQKRQYIPWSGILHHMSCEHRAAYFWCALGTFPYIFIMVQNALTPGYFLQSLQTSSRAYAGLSISYGIGALLGASLEKAFGRYIKCQPLFLMVNAIFVFGYLALFKNKNVVYGHLIIASLAAFHVWARIERVRWVMDITPDHFMGRIQGLFDSFALLAIVIITYFVTYFSDRFTINSGFLSLSVLACILFLSFLLSSSVRRTPNKVHGEYAQSKSSTCPTLRSE